MIRKNTNIGESIRNMRETKGMTRNYLAEKIGISVSHLEKIESGSRRPGMETFIKILEVLNAEIVMNSDGNTIHGQCILKTREILLQSTEEEALFLTKVVEFIVLNMHILSK